MSSQDVFLLVINPIAGGNDKTEVINMVQEFANAHNILLKQYKTTGENDDEAIVKLCEKHNPERILVAGGDGTIKMVAEAVEGYNVVIGILPVGSANGLSVDLNLPDDIKENLEIACSGDFAEIDMVDINGKKSLHLSDIGVNAELIKNYECGSIRGKLGYALQVINTLKELEDPFEVTIETNEKVLKSHARMVVIANSNRYGTGVTINPIGKMNDGKFEMIVLKNLDILVVGKIMAGKIPVDSNEDVEIISAEKATLKTNVPVSFQIDGEYCGELDRLDIKIVHKKMKIAVPKKND